MSGDWGVRKVRGSAYVADPRLQASAQLIKHQEPNAYGKWRDDLDSFRAWGRA